MPETGEGAVRAAFRQQAAWCRSLGSPLTALLCDLVADCLDRGTALGRRMLDWPAQPGPGVDVLPLRLAGGLHALARLGHRRLAECYPPYSLPDADTLWAAICSGLGDPGLPSWLDSPPQTNEVMRSAVLMAGLLVVAAETGLPLALHELGASAGLNLLLDLYDIRLGGLQTGTPGSAVVLQPDWSGPLPPDVPVQVVRRRGVDLNPLDARDPATAARLIAYVWPDQPQRLSRLVGALAIARTEPPVVDAGDAADWTESQIDVVPEAGVARVLMHSVAWVYFPPSVQARIAAHMEAAGRRATAAAPLAWLRFEAPPGLPQPPELRLQTWPGDVDRQLGTGGPHVQWMRWAVDAP